jgi:hypothetical protein
MIGMRHGTQEESLLDSAIGAHIDSEAIFQDNAVILYLSKQRKHQGPSDLIAKGGPVRCFRLRIPQSLEDGVAQVVAFPRAGQRFSEHPGIRADLRAHEERPRF